MKTTPARFITALIIAAAPPTVLAQNEPKKEPAPAIATENEPDEKPSPGLDLLEKGKYKEAVSFLLREWEENKRTLGPDAPVHARCCEQPCQLLPDKTRSWRS